MKRFVTNMMFAGALLSAFNSYSQKNTPSRTIEFGGSLQHISSGKAEVKVKCYPLNISQLEFSPHVKNYSAVLKNGNFKIAVQPFQDTGYISVSLPESKFPRAFMNPMLVLAGDRISFSTNNGKLIFKGDHADLYNCQVLMNAVEMPTNFPDSFKSSTDELQAFVDFFKRSLDARLDILQSYKGKINECLLNILKVNEELRYFTVTGNFLNGMTSAGGGFDRSQLLPFYEKFAANYAIDISSVNTDNTFSYASYLFLKELLYFRLSHIMYAYDSKYFSPGDFFRVVMEKYEGRLRDQMLAAYFTSFAALVGNDSVGAFKLQALSVIKSQDCREILHRSNALFAKGSPFYHFKYQDTLGIIRKLPDFRGKVLIVDFWNDGCTGCAHLTQAMHPVVEEFKDNKDVVFISIDLDKDRNVWVKNIHKGIYTTTGGTNLYTNGKGFDDPIVDYYGFNGVPQLFLIDKCGNILFENPPRPSNQDSTLKFIRIIKDYLNEGKKCSS